MAAERLLQRGQPGCARERLHGRDGRPVGLYGEQAAAAHRDAVEEHRARAADAVLAADVRPREPEPVAEEVGQQQSRLDRSRTVRAVDGELDLDHRARSIARADERAGQRRGGSRRGVRRRRGIDEPCGERARIGRRVDPEEPTSSASTSGRRVGRSVTAPTPTRASTTTRLATEHDRGHRLREVAGAERELLECARLPSVASGQTVSTTSSPGASVVRKCVTKKSAAAISRRPPRLARPPLRRGRRGRAAARRRRPHGRSSRRRCRGSA